MRSSRVRLQETMPLIPSAMTFPAKWAPFFAEWCGEPRTRWTGTIWCIPHLRKARGRYQSAHSLREIHCFLSAHGDGSGRATFTRTTREAARRFRPRMSALEGRTRKFAARLWGIRTASDLLRTHRARSRTSSTDRAPGPQWASARNPDRRDRAGALSRD